MLIAIVIAKKIFDTKIHLLLEMLIAFGNEHLKIIVSGGAWLNQFMYRFSQIFPFHKKWKKRQQGGQEVDPFSQNKLSKRIRQILVLSQ